MDITDKQIEEAEAKATPVQMSLYSGSEAGRQIRAIAKQFGIDTDRSYQIFAITVGDFVLKLIPKQQIHDTLEERLPGLSDEQLNGLVPAIEKYLQPVYAEDSVNLKSEIDNLETTMSRLQTLRTMSDDMHVAKEEVVHRSSQDELLRKNTTPETHTGMPRWGSEV